MNRDALQQHNNSRNILAKSLSKTSGLTAYFKEYLGPSADVVGLLVAAGGFGFYLYGILNFNHFLYLLLAIGVVIFIIFSFQIIGLRKTLGEIKILFELNRLDEQYKNDVKAKFNDVGVEEIPGVCEFNYQHKARIKKMLIEKTEHSVFATHLVDIDLPKPLEQEDEINYFKGNVKALEKIKANNGEGINRIFLISEDVLKNKAFCDDIKARIKKHSDESFNVKLALYQNLQEPISFDFAIYDNQFVFRLSVNSYKGEYGKQRGYFAPTLVDIYKKRWINIESQSLEPKDFWEKHYNF